MRLKGKLLSLTGAVLGLIFATSPTMAGCGPRGGDDGASYATGGTSHGGVQADLDFTGNSVPSGEMMGNAVVMHMDGTDEYLVLGTYKGESPGPDCPADFSDKNSYREGRRFGQYFCDTDGGWPTYEPSDPPKNFYIYHVGFGSWTTSVGSYESSRSFEGFEGRGSVAAWMSYSSVARAIDTEFDEIQKYGSGGWTYFSSGANSCEDAGYDLRTINNHHVWAEKE